MIASSRIHQLLYGFAAILIFFIAASGAIVYRHAESEHLLRIEHTKSKIKETLYTQYPKIIELKNLDLTESIDAKLKRLVDILSLKSLELKHFSKTHNYSDKLSIKIPTLPSEISEYYLIANYVEPRKDLSIYHLFIFATLTIFSVVLLAIIFIKKTYIQPMVKFIQNNRENIEPEKQIREKDTTIESLISTVQNITKAKSEIKVYKQMAHDIRSPLAALEMAVLNTKNIDEETRTFITSATNRISDIANNLETKSGSQKKDGNSKILIPSLCSLIVSEKRMQYRDLNNIELSLELDPSAYSIFSKINATEFKIILSNLINNSVEAIPKDSKGKINLAIKKCGSSTKIELSDNGKGIPKNILRKLGVEQISHGKLNGQGLGTSHAAKILNEWGGTISFDSNIGEGTTVTIKLPLVAPPKTYVDGINVSYSSRVAVVDDDQTIHDIWNKRFDKETTITHFTDPSSFVKSIESKDQYDIYLIDYEYIGHEINGIEISERIKDRTQVYLVTSHYEDIEVIEACERLGIGLIPKGMAPIVPIKDVSIPAEVVLIDDEELVHTAWKYGVSDNVKVHNFSSVDDFIKIHDHKNNEIEIFLDQNLSNGKLGTEESARITDLGYKNIILATGEKIESPPPWIIKVKDKRIPKHLRV